MNLASLADGIGGSRSGKPNIFWPSFDISPNLGTNRNTYPSQTGLPYLQRRVDHGPSHDAGNL